MSWSGFSVEFSATVAVLFSPVTFAAKVILLCLHLVKQTDKEMLSQMLHLLTTPMTGAMGYRE